MNNDERTNGPRRPSPRWGPGAPPGGREAAGGAAGGGRLPGPSSPGGRSRGAPHFRFRFRRFRCLRRLRRLRDGRPVGRPDGQESIAAAFAVVPAVGEGGGAGAIGRTVYSKRWLFGVLTDLIQVVSTENAKGNSDEEEQRAELDEEMENEICKVWDMSMDEDVALFLQEFKAPDIFLGVLAKSKCPRLTEICVGILGNMACFQEICVAISNDENLGQVLLHCLCDSDAPTLLETNRLLLTCLSQPEVASVWVERIREHPSVFVSVCFIMSSSTNVDLLVKVGEVVDKLFDLDEKLMLDWIRNGDAQPPDQSAGDAEEPPVFKIVPCVLEAAKQIRSDNPEGLDVYMHILQLLTTVDEGIQAIVQCPAAGSDAWNLLYDLVLNDLCQADDPPIIIQEQKTVLASIFSVLSAMYASRMEREYLRIEKSLPLVGSLIRVLQNVEDCQNSAENATESDPGEPERSDGGEMDFHLKILKDVSCEFLSSVFRDLTKENVAEGLKRGYLSKRKCSCALKNLLPLYITEVETFLKVLHEADESLAGELMGNFPSLKVRT
ncbi:protein SAAL1 [Tachyglossus aculeatus]|uniref:protein SAAL1 n=1 Tax=Tachyglossus aculeatus TaxID=9261 RepID=UPI0018F4EA51|nr:protein SAAL1 [Tachyglossus aculeatus]